MKYFYHKLLKDIKEKVGAQEFGRVVQDIIAIALRRLDFTNIESRYTGHPDIRASFERETYAFEVETLKEPKVDLKEIFKALKQEPVTKRLFIFLDSSFPTRLYVIDIDKVETPYEMIITYAKMYREEALTQRLNKVFPQVVKQYYELLKRYGSSEAIRRLIRERQYII